MFANFKKELTEKKIIVTNPKSNCQLLFKLCDLV